MRDFIREMWPVALILFIMASLVGFIIWDSHRDVERCKAAGGQLFHGAEVAGQACIRVPFTRIERW